MDNKTKHHDKMHNNGKHLAYTGLATITLIGGMGATPVILADELIIEKIEGTSTDDKTEVEASTAGKTDEKAATSETETTAPSVTAETPAPLPDNKVILAPAKTESTVKVAEEPAADTPTQKSGVKSAENIEKTGQPAAKAVVPNAEPEKAGKTKESRAGVHHTFTAADFVINGTTLTKLTDDFKNNVYPTWDGDFTLDGNADASLKAITIVGNFAFTTGGPASDSKLTNVTFKNMPALTTIQHTFDSCANLTSASFINLQSLTNLAYRELATEPLLTTIVFDNLPAMTQIDSYAFVSNHAVTDLTFNNMPNFTTFAANSFGNSNSLQTLNLNNLPNLTTIEMGAFSNNNLTSLTLDGLNNLTTIGANAFSESYGGMDTVILRNLRSLTTIGENAFNLNYGFRKLIVGNLPSLTADGIHQEAFMRVQSGGQVVPDRGQTDLPLANIFVGKINNSAINQFNKRYSANNTNNSVNGQVWYVQTAVNYNFVDENNNPLADPTTDNRPGEVRIGDIINLNPDASDADINPVTRYNAVPALDIPGYTVVPSLTRITNTNTLNLQNADANTIDSLTQIPLVTYVYSPNPIAGSVTYKYIDQDDQEILVDANGDSVDPYYKSGIAGDTYNLADGVPDIPGYGKPERVSGNETGVLGEGDTTITYRYHAKADPITIYWVDTDDQPLADPEVVTDAYVDDMLDLGAKQQTFSGYDFLELYGSAPLVAKAMTDYTWENAHSLIGTQLTFATNTGRNYKFVYAKQTNTDTDTNTDNGDNTDTNTGTDTNTDNGNSTDTNTGTNTGTDTGNTDTSTGTNKPTPPKLPATGDDTQTPPKKKPSNGGTKKPSDKKLPGTGGDTGTVTNHKKATSTVKANSTKELPESGDLVNRLLPVIGATLLAGLIGLYAFRKQRK